MIGDLLFDEELYVRSLGAYKEAVLCGKPGVNLADSYYNIARVHMIHYNNNNEAIEFLRRSLDVHKYHAATLKRTLEECPAVAAIHHLMGTARANQGLHGPALRSLTRALDIYERTGETCHEATMAQVLNAMGTIYQQLGDLESALDCHQDALELQQKSECPSNLPAVADTLSNIAAVHQARWYFHGANAAYQEVVATHRTSLRLTPDDDAKPVRLRLAVSLSNWADLLVRRQPSAAAEMYAEAFALNKVAGLKDKDPRQYKLQSKLFWLNHN